MSQSPNGLQPASKFYNDVDRHKLRSLKPDPMAETRARFHELFDDVKYAKESGASVAEILRVLKDLGVDIVRGTFERWYDAECKSRTLGSDSN
ncbi:hypothetical protein [Paraburkholderia sp. MM5477-R1]|uniref:hypothetical protein n=1 Tax=Paraburkholderia sp. MM5477-R1 TaxID=2991062 RepID=UPI003D1E7A6C